MLEVLRDDLLHFEVSAIGPGRDTTTALFTTPQVAKTDYAGLARFAQSGVDGDTIETAQMRVGVNPGNLCIALTDIDAGGTWPTGSTSASPSNTALQAG
ncbi:MAG: hypothetical protein WCA32_22080 [Chromatiaceae bacterium]